MSRIHEHAGIFAAIGAVATRALESPIPGVVERLSVVASGALVSAITVWIWTRYLAPRAERLVLVVWMRISSPPPPPTIPPIRPRAPSHPHTRHTNLPPKE